MRVTGYERPGGWVQRAARTGGAAWTSAVGFGFVSSSTFAARDSDRACTDAGSDQGE
jgi:hypothetical protein